MWLMARKRIESWLWWIAVDARGIGYARAVDFVASLFMAIKGLVTWGGATREGVADWP